VISQKKIEKKQKKIIIRKILNIEQLKIRKTNQNLRNKKSKKIIATSKILLKNN
jgi:hypothetical protein